MRIAINGRSGQVATAMAERTPLGSTLMSIGRPEFDLSFPENAKQVFEAARPDLIVSAAAYTAVDKAETERDAAFQINADGAGAVANVAASLGIPIVHLSTDYVFDGSKAGAWIEGDPTLPLGVYGASKLAGEHAVLSATSNAIILRVAWIYSPFGNNFVRTMLRLAGRGQKINVVDDQIGRPTSALDIADAIWGLAANLLEKPQDKHLRGIFHMPAAGRVASWADFSSAIFDGMVQRGLQRPELGRIGTRDYPTPARRPANSVLDGSKLAHIHGIVLPDWQTSLDAVLDRLLNPVTDATRKGM